MTTDKSNIDVYADTAFTSGWNTEQEKNPDSVKSCADLIVEIMGCPVIWCSKVQPCITTSTIMSECTALSTSL